jgi:alkylation response protein AidB-like acyl-CoA dehydrogenase
MDLTFTPEQEQFRLRVRQWFEENLPEGWGTPHFKWPESIEERKKWMREWERKLYEAGFAGLSWPKDYGGQGMTLVEEAGKLNAPLGFNVLGKLLLGPTLLLYGSEEQKKRFLPPLLRGEEFWCQGFSEPNAGSDLASLQTRAVLDGDEWVINGQKVWTSFAHYADWCFVLARTDPKAPKHKGITFFLVPMNSPGVTVRPLVQLNGNRDFNEVFFDDVRIPKENVVGGVNNGWKVAMSTLGFERGTLALGRQVRFQQELDEMARVSATIRTPDGSLAIDNPYYRQRLAQMQAEVRIFRYLCLKTISQLLNEGKLGPDASLQKLYWSTMHVRMGNLGMEILGPEAPYWGEDSVSRGMIQQIHLTSRGEIIYAGSSQIQKNIIAEKVLGMPK